MRGHHARGAGPRTLRPPARARSPFQPFAEGGFGTPDGKCHFHAETLDYTPPVESRHGDAGLRAQYPLELISPKNDDSMNSTFGHRDAVDLQTAAVHLHAADAAPLGIRTGDQVRVYNDRGSCVLIARVDDSVRPGVVCAPSVRWPASAPGQPQRQCLDLRALDRCRRRSHFLQLPGASGEERRLMSTLVEPPRGRGVGLAVGDGALRLQPKTESGTERRRRAAPMSSIVHTGDPKSETQLVKGFYGIEQNSWRWTAQQFSVILRPPAGAAQKGATLNLQLAVPDATINKLKTVTLSASAGGAALPPETYTQVGGFTYTRDVPAGQLTGESVKIDFQLDKALPPNGGDLRDLGLIVNSVALDAK